MRRTYQNPTVKNSISIIAFFIKGIVLVALAAAAVSGVHMLVEAAVNHNEKHQTENNN